MATAFVAKLLKLTLTLLAFCLTLSGQALWLSDANLNDLISEHAKQCIFETFKLDDYGIARTMTTPGLVAGFVIKDIKSQNDKVSFSLILHSRGEEFEYLQSWKLTRRSLRWYIDEASSTLVPVIHRASIFRTTRDASWALEHSIKVDGDHEVKFPDIPTDTNKVIGGINARELFLERGKRQYKMLITPPITDPAQVSAKLPELLDAFINTVSAQVVEKSDVSAASQYPGAAVCLREVMR